MYYLMNKDNVVSELRAVKKSALTNNVRFETANIQGTIPFGFTEIEVGTQICIRTNSGLDNLYFEREIHLSPERAGTVNEQNKAVRKIKRIDFKDYPKRD